MGKQFIKISLLIALFFLFSYDALSQVTTDWKEHKVSDKLFTVKYPPTWKLNDSTDVADFLITSPKETVSDQFDENFNLQYRDLSDRAIDLKKYVKLNVDELRSFDNYKKVSDRYFYWFGKETYEIIFTGNVRGIPFSLKWKQWYVIYKQKGYVITYCTEEGKKDKYESVQNAIFKSIRIK